MVSTISSILGPVDKDFFRPAIFGIVHKWCPILGGKGGLKKIRLYKVKIGLSGGGGVKNDSKKSDIIYEWSLSICIVYT